MRFTIIFLSIFLPYILCSEVSSISDLPHTDTNNVCGGVFIKDQFFLTSEDIKMINASNIICEYVLKGPQCPTFYQFEFLNFDLNNDTNCSFQIFNILNENIFCGRKNGSESYFSSNGTLKVIFSSKEYNEENSFNISVKRMPCEDFERADTNIEDMDSSKTDRPTKTTPNVFKPFNLPFFPKEDTDNACCSKIFNSKRFILTSPEFPYSINKPTQCTYKIQKASRNICRLRLNFLFFWLGTSDTNNCPYGYLEIDGTFICGCNKELKLVTAFENKDNIILRFKSNDLTLNSQSGFVIEVIQDECPLKYHPDDLKNTTEHYRSYLDQLNRISWPNENHSIEKLQLINRRTEILNDNSFYAYLNSPKIVKSFYYFAEPDYNAIPSYQDDLDRTTYLDIKTLNSVITNLNHLECTNWNQMRMYKLTEKYGIELQSCSLEKEDIGNSRSNCVELDYLQGYFRSPGYPCFYPGNLDICYRFRKTSGYCAIRIFMNDFSIERSYGCNKDFVRFDGYRRHCGSELYRRTVTLDIKDKAFVEMQFQTDSFKCGRGFSGIYEQIPCQRPIYPITPPSPQTTAKPSCDRYIRERFFTIQSLGDHEKCLYRIMKSAPTVCKIKLYFDMFSLDCTTEALIVDGMIYCGNLNGKIISVNFLGKTIQKEIVYKSTSLMKFGISRLLISGEQISNDCIFDDPEVPPQRLSKIDYLQEDEKVLDDRNDIFKGSGLQYSPEYVIRMRSHSQDICAVIKNVNKRLPEELCDIVRKHKNATYCEVLRGDVNNYFIEKNNVMKLLQDNAHQSHHQIQYGEIDCEELK